jgi:methyl-accepting chemotaxis protein
VTDPGNDTRNAAVDTVVRSFTEAELALTEIAGAIERFRSASDQLLAASERQETVSSALAASTDASQAIATQLGAVVQGLSQATEALRAVQPGRLWQHLERVETDRKAEVALVRADLAKAQWRITTVFRVAIIGAIGGLVTAALFLLVVARVVSL